MRRDLEDDQDWKKHASFDAEGGFYQLATRDTGDVPVRLFLTETLFREADHKLYRQIVNATSFPGAKLVVITPDVHFGYGVPVGCVIVTDRDAGAIAMGPVGFDIGCGMMSAKSDVSAEMATPDRKLAFHREVMRRVALGPGGTSRLIDLPSDKSFEDLVRGGAEEYVARSPGSLGRENVERQRIPVGDDWVIPWGGKGKPERGVEQLGTLGGGNHFIELQRCEETKTLFVQVHTGSRGFGHGLATNYFEMAKDEHPERGSELDLGYFTPESKHYRQYQNAVAAGGNFAIVNRLLIFEAIRGAFEKVFKADLELIYEISHNLVQAELHPEFGEVWVHRKGATRAFPANHPQLQGTRWEATGHPVLIPGSNRDYSFILQPQAGAVKSAFSVNHGAGRRMSRGEATKILSQQKTNEQYARDQILVNLDGKVPLDEAGACYKSSREVIAAVVDSGLATITHTLWPLGSLKGTETRGKPKPASKKQGSDGPEPEAAATTLARDRAEAERNRQKERRETRRLKTR